MRQPLCGRRYGRVRGPARPHALQLRPATKGQWGAARHPQQPYPAEQGRPAQSPVRHVQDARPQAPASRSATRARRHEGPPVTIPAGLHEWAHARNVSPFHPGTWDAETCAAFAAWKLAKFKARWRVALENGDVAATRRLCGRDYLLRKVKDDLAFALAPPPSEVYRSCPC